MVSSTRGVQLKHTESGRFQSIPLDDMTESLVRIPSEANAPPASPESSAESELNDLSSELFVSRDWSELIPARQHLLSPAYEGDTEAVIAEINARDPPKKGQYY